MTILFTKLLPIFALIGIGHFTRKWDFFQESFINQMKSLVLKIALPAVLFDSFSRMDLEIDYLFLFVFIFLYCTILYGLGFLLNYFFSEKYPYQSTKGYMTGFEFGMIGVGLFSAIWGMENLSVIMLIAFGHELFIWFFYVINIAKNKSERVSFQTIITKFIKTPTILAILFGIILNVTGIRIYLDTVLLGQSLQTLLDFLKPLTSPLILIIIGYTMILKKGNFKKLSFYMLTRMILVLGVGTVVLFFINVVVKDLGPLFNIAFYAFICLPAPYILPLYIKDKNEVEFMTQLLVYSTIMSFLFYGVLVYIFFK